MNENSPLKNNNNKAGGGFYVLTSYSTEECVGDPAESSSGGGGEDTSGGERRRKFSRIRKENSILKRVPPPPTTTIVTTMAPPSQSGVAEAFRILERMELLVNARLKEADRVKDPTPVIIAFTILEGTRYADVADVSAFEKGEEYTQHRAGAVAITDDQLCVDMQCCKWEFKGVVSVLLYLRGGVMKDSPLHTVIQRQTYKTKNSCENLLERFCQPSLRGHYYRVLVDFAQSQ
jgi:hypothetical protein